MANHRRTTVRTQRAFTISRVGRALTILAGVPADEIPETSYPSVVDRMSDKQVTAQFAMMIMHAAPWGEA